MPRNNSMPSPEKRRPLAGFGAKGTSTNGPRSPPRTSRTSPSSPRKGAGGSGSGTNSGTNTNTNTINSTFIAPPPRAALSGTSSPAPDHPRNNNPNANTATTHPTTRRAPSHPPSRSPSPLPRHTTTTTTSSSTTTHPPIATAPTPTPTAAPTALATTTASASAAAALRARDARIAALEREQALMEAEFARELDKHAAAEARAAAFWQGKCAALEAALAQAGVEAEGGVGDGLVRGGSSSTGGGLLVVGKGRRGDGGVDNRGWDRRDGDGEGDEDGVWRGDGRRKRGIMAGDEEEEMEEEEREAELRELRTAWERAREALARRDDEVARLRAQVRGLKEWVSVSTRADGQAQTSDEVFGEGMARLGNGLQNWVLVNFRRARVDLSSADEDAISELARLVPMYEELASRSKIHLLQSVVSRLLVELVFDAYFAGLPCDMAGQLKQVESMLASFASSPESINQWRSLTLTILKKDAHEKLQSESSSVIDTVVSRVNKLLDAITTNNTTATDARDQGLQALVANAIELSRLLAVQKAVFRVEMPVLLPHQRTVFDPETMEDIGGEEDEDSLADREICCVAFPGIVKRGDESGGQLQFRNVIAKAKVLCSPE